MFGKSVLIGAVYIRPIYKLHHKIIRNIFEIIAQHKLQDEIIMLGGDFNMSMKYHDGKAYQRESRTTIQAITVYAEFQEKFDLVQLNTVPNDGKNILDLLITNLPFGRYNCVEAEDTFTNILRDTLHHKPMVFHLDLN